MSLTKLSLAGKYFNYSRPGRVWSVTSRLETGKQLTFFYSAHWLRKQIRAFVKSSLVVFKGLKIKNYLIQEFSFNFFLHFGAI
jgi:hypothetical protein